MFRLLLQILIWHWDGEEIESENEKLKTNYTSKNVILCNINFS